MILKGSATSWVAMQRTRNTKRLFATPTRIFTAVKYERKGRCARGLEMVQRTGIFNTHESKYRPIYISSWSWAVGSDDSGRDYYQLGRQR